MPFDPTVLNPPRMTDSYSFFNNCIFTAKDVPLPISDDERIILFYDNVKFYCSIGSGSLAGTSINKSPDGKIFLTNYRIIYKPSIPCSNIAGSQFVSFHCSLNSIESIHSGEFSLITPRNIVISTVYFDVHDSSDGTGIFTNILLQTKEKFRQLKKNPDSTVKYYYSDIRYKPQK